MGVDFEESGYVSIFSHINGCGQSCGVTDSFPRPSDKRISLMRNGENIDLGSILVSTVGSGNGTAGLLVNCQSVEIERKESGQHPVLVHENGGG